MGDLISRESVIKLLCELRVDNVAVNGKRITEYINELPTAYDVEKIVAELEKLRKDADFWSDCEEDYFSGKSYAFEDSISIVKRGGVE